MAKKRRDSKRDPSSSQRLLKAGRTALAVGAGAVLFSRSNMGKKVVSETIPALLETKKTYSAALLGKKHTAMNMHDAYMKSIGKKGEVFKKTLSNKKNIKYNPSTATRDNLLGKYKYISQIANNKVADDFHKKFDEDILQGVLKELKKDEKFKKYDFNDIEKIVRSTYAKKDEIKKGSEINTAFLKKTKEVAGMDDLDLEDIVTSTLNTLNDRETQTLKTVKSRKIYNFSKKVKEVLTTDLKKDTRENLRINKLGKILGVDNLEEKLLGSRAATLQDVLDNPDILNKDIKGDFKVSSLEELKKLVDNDEDFGNVIFDRNLRVRTRDGKKEFFDATETMSFFNDLTDKFDSTLPGKVLTKGIDRKQSKNAPDYFMLQAGKKSVSSHFDDSDNQTLQEAKVYLAGKLYRITENEQGYDLGETLLEDAHLVGMRHGSAYGVLTRMLGSNRRNYTASDNPILQMLDINQDGQSNFLMQGMQFFKKFSNPDWTRNRIDRVIARLNTDMTLDEEVQDVMNQYGLSAVEAMAQIHEDNKAVLELFKNKASSNVVDDDALVKIRDAMDLFGFDEKNERVGRFRELINLALSSDRPEDVIEQLVSMNENGVSFTSDGLINITKRYRANAVETMEMLSIESTKTKKIPIMDIELSETNVMGVKGIVRQEIIKEMLSDEELSSMVLSSTELNGQQLEAVSLLSHWRKFEHATTAPDVNDIFTALFNPGSTLDLYETSLIENDASRGSLNRILMDMRSDYNMFHKGDLGNINENYYGEFNAFEALPKSSIGEDLIKNLNSFTKMKKAMAELNGGRSNLENVTSATLVVQYMINRLSYGVESAGLGLSHQSMGTPLDTIKNLMLKRVAPAMAAFTAFNYLNDTSQDITGVGITGAMANTLSNFDILGRGLAYKTGLGQGLDWFKRTSVIAEYWTGSTDFQTAEERKDWYEDGYSPVRKSRFWGFGSASEFRGGDITFFQPNYLRRAHSDYKDKVIYGSNKEKWAHSIIPTPTHPLSTIRYLMDPYWLERKHIEDAPTPLTGKMFSEGSLWGAILNPTVGEVIKPQIMLPEIKKRMTSKGHDAQGIVRRLNERIKRKANEYDDMLVVSGTDIRNATYVPYGNATPGVITVTDGKIRGIDYMDKVQNIDHYRTPDGTTYSERTGGGFGPVITRRMDDGGIVHNTVDSFLREVNGETRISEGVVAAVNTAIKRKHQQQLFGDRGRQGGPSFAAEAPDASYEGTYIYNNLVNEYNKFAAQYYSDKIDPTMLNTNKYGDYLADAKHSVKNLAGIYGFATEQLFGEDSFSLRYENAGSYSSFSRGFWDAGVGGLGGNVMEIARRFFPSQDRSRIDYNPLVNNMPEWLPDHFHYGVPWTKVTKGEMRLPGKGYESLNELHPDEWADERGYGSFDKFKILADVAPNSNEYKIWHNIVKHNTKDPALKQEIKEIEARVKRMSGSHEFYEYQYLHTNTKYEEGVVKTINQDGTVTLANNQILTLAGIEFNDKYNGELGQFIKPGDHITYRTTDDAINDLEEGVIRNAAIYQGSDNINKKLMDMGVADRDMTDTSAIGNLATVSPTQEVWGAVQEVIAHARIPIIHNKLMHIETPLEAFISEQINGANFQTWDHPIEGFVKPMLNEVAGQGFIRRGLARGYRDFHFNKIMTQANSQFGNKAKKFASGAVLATLDPATLLGGGIEWMLRLNNGRHGDGKQVLGAYSHGAKIGGTVGDVVWAWSQADNPLTGAIAFGALAADIYTKYEVGEYLETVLKKSSSLKGAVTVGAALGVGVSAIKNSDWDKDQLFGPHKPKKYRKINEINEYFDRLEYIKYQGLYESAARKAALLEGTDIKGIFKDIDKNKKKIAKLKKKAEDLLKKYDEGDSEYIAQKDKIMRQINSLQEQGNNMFKGGKYTKSAVAYKKAMESTIYGLSEMSTKDEILAAVPDQYKDYFQRFMNETDESERKKILKHLPDYLKRPLQAAWGMKLAGTESNGKYFRTHKLPGLNWRGWKPNINLKHVQMKTIQNEGMLLADFGFYESEKGKAAYTIAPDIENYDTPSDLGMFASLRLKAEMKGLGLGLTNVSIDRTSAPGMWISADIKQSIEDRTELTTNSMTNALQGLAANFF